MIEEIGLDAQPRQEIGKGTGRRLRAVGRIPAVIYGLACPPRSVSVNIHELERLVHKTGEHGMIALRIGGQAEVEHVLLRESQRDPVTDRLVHADFYRIDPQKPVHIDVPITSVGTAIGQKEGGILEQLVRHIEVRCLPKDLPRIFECDVSNIQLNHSLHVSEITAPEAVEILTAPETALFTVLLPRKIEEKVAEVAEEAEVTEPELVEKEKKEEEDAGETGGKKK